MENPDTRLTEEQKAELAALAAMPDDEIDFSDIPETLDWSGARRLLRLRQPPRLAAPR